MNFYICQDWKSTSGNHAGMVHLCKSIEELDPINNKVIIIKKDLQEINIIRRFRKYIFNFDLYKIVYLFSCLFLLPKIKKNDKIFLMEYLHKEKNQLVFAQCIRFVFKDKIKIYGLVHLFPETLEKWFKNQEFIKWSDSVDYIITLGSSLTSFLLRKNIPETKIITTFHYVDNDYYKSEIKNKETVLKVVAMGNLNRNFELLVDIVKQIPDVEFHICKGLVNIDELFSEHRNVKLYGYLTEDELKNVIAMSDVSLNVMNDTIGSNVITTSMAMGLAMIVSDVGSIRDYCDYSNSFFCFSKQDYIQSIVKLNADRILLNSMKESSLKMSSKLGIQSFYEQIKKW